MTRASKKMINGVEPATAAKYSGIHGNIISKKEIEYASNLCLLNQFNKWLMMNPLQYKHRSCLRY